jgi:hypothetical protein
MFAAGQVARLANAADGFSAEQFQAQLAAGEFAPAQAMAQQVANPRERDALLVQIAQAQAAAGGPALAVTTLASIESDVTRNDAVKQARQAAPNRGGAVADFNTLIDLITTTVKPDTWDEVGGPGTVAPFRNGVYVDPQGVLQRVIQPAKSQGLAVARLDALKATDNKDTRRDSALRKVSLPRLEKHLQLMAAAGRRPTEDMLHMAGLEKIQYVMVYPETGDLVIAGPASDWHRDAEGRPVSNASGRPVLQLDDMIVLLRFMKANPNGTFGCSITPTQQGLQRTKAFAEQSSAAPLKPGQRPAWLSKLRSQMGRQTITVQGVDPRTRLARLLVEADYRMKLVGMGLEDGTADVPSYLKLVSAEKGAAPPPMDVLRWWFTLKYDAVQATADRDAFEIRGPGVQVLSENEMLTALGERVHTGQSEPLNSEFAQRFTKHFGSLTEKYPVYADLQNVFDMGLVAAMIQSQNLAERVNWHMTCFLDPEQYQVALGPAPQQVETVINHKVINQKFIVVGVSGGVHVQPANFVSNEAIKTDEYGKLKASLVGAKPGEMALDAWWWD